MSAPYNGGCQCGKIKYVVEAEPQLTVFCHCKHCQKESGGPFSVRIIVPKVAVSIDGELSSFEVIADSGSKAIRKFCGTCGCPILVEFERADYKDDACIAAGSLDDPSWLQPQFHCFTATKQPWVQICDALPQLESDT